MKSVLIVEDDREIRGLLKDFLEENKYEVSEAKDGNVASELINNEKYDIILMDMMLPFKSGDILIQELRELKDTAKNSTPVIVLSAKTMKDTRLEVLRMGADDYITKPFDMQELLARIRRALRSHYKENPSEGDENERLAIKDLIMIPSRYEVRVKGEFVQLTKKEYALLEFLLRNKRNVLSREQILQAVWGYDYNGDTNVVDVYIRYLRSKIDERYQEKYIYTVRGIGYAVRD